MSDIALDVLTYSSGTTLCLCERKYRFRYEQRLRPKVEEDFEARDIGHVFHIGCEAYLTDGLDAGLKAIADWRDSQTVLGPDAWKKIEQLAGKARAMLRASAVKWPRESFPASCEQIVERPIRNPETGASSRSFLFRGKVDGLTNDRLIDWKGVGDPDDFIRSQTIGYQVECYALAVGNIAAMEFRLVTRPSIKFCGKDADAQAYEYRCLEWLLADPRNLLTHEVLVNPARTENAEHWLWSASKRVLENRRTGRWATNALACKTWNRDCEYLRLCLIEANGGDSSDLIASDYQESDPHPELAAV